jgi:DNA-binding SARP family transcriptional activator
MMLGQGEYRKAADFLDQAQLAFDAVGMAPPGGALAVAAQLCVEIVRWQQMRERGQIGAHDAEVAIAEVQRDLSARLNLAATSVRAAPDASPDVDRVEGMFLIPKPPAMLVLPDSLAAQPNLSGWLARLWRRLVHGDDAPAVENLTQSSAVTLLPMTPPDIEIDEPIEADSFADSVVEPAPIITMSADEAPAQSFTRTLAAQEPELARPAYSGLAIYCFGNFRVYCNDALIDRWESARGRTILKYLIARRMTAVPKELLADMFWPDSEPELARRSLHQAIYCLRQKFKRLMHDIQVIQFVDDRYQINPEIAIWVDSEQFGQLIEQARALATAGKVEQAMQAYAVAVDLYKAPFLAEDRYEEWTDELRRAYQAAYLEALHRLAHHHVERGEHSAAILLCQRALAEESCDEDSHQMLMSCYMSQGLRHLAVRQYQICINSLKTDLNLAPSEELEAFYRRVVAAG